MADDDRPDLAAHRRSYDHGVLSLDGLAVDERRDPLVALRRWLDEAIEDGRDPEPTAMVLATVRRSDHAVGSVGADARVVLCKAVDEGVVFYTNSRSAKGRQLGAAPTAAAVFHWPALERQLRCRGSVTVLSPEQSDRYFESRPRASQLGAWVSAQSRPIDSRLALERLVDEAAARFAGHRVTRPEGWQGYRIVPDEIELWQGRADRLHDRLLATRRDGGWDWTRLQP